MNWQQSRGAQLYKRAKQIIPGGTQLLSKRPEMFLPELWPSYYSRAKGCRVWDVDGNGFIDMTTCGIGACLLGFSDEDVNSAVKRKIDDGSMSTLNVPEEIELAELLCEIHPWADMVRYARTGGEAMSVAVRIARAHTRRDKLLICGYHGWNDWYLAANLSADHALDGHLLPGLAPQGVPKSLQGTALTFHYNRFDELESLIAGNEDQIAAIVMEPFRTEVPKDGFIEKVKEAAARIGAVLIFDEITSAWRHTFGGIHLELGINPDIAVFAKSISNGFPMAAIIGQKNVMESAQNSFISSTYWTEAVGPTAALATLHKMKEVNLSEHLKTIGGRVCEGWKNLASRHGLDITVSGKPGLCRFSFNCGQARELRTLLTQFMLENGFLASNTFYPTLAHTPEIVDEYLAALAECFKILNRAVENDNVLEHLQGPVAHDGFARLA